MQRENNSLSLRLSLAMNNATDVSGVYNGISGMISSDCQCLRPTELLAGCTYARVFTVLLFRVESLHISYDRGIGESYHENNKKYKTKTKTNRFIKGEELCGRERAKVRVHQHHTLLSARQEWMKDLCLCCSH